MKIDGGKIKVVFDRARSYAQTFNTVMIAYLFIKQAGWHWWYSLILVFMVFVMVYDWYYVIAQERDTIWTRPGKLNDMRLQIDELHKKLVDKQWDI